jgi:uncharacterized membrane protein YidH (DUF202 family)
MMILMTVKIENTKTMMVNIILIAANLLQMTIDENNDTDHCNRKYEIGINRTYTMIKFVVYGMMIIMTIISSMIIFKSAKERW